MGSAAKPVTLATTAMRPPWRRRMSGRTAAMQLTVPMMFTSIWGRKTSGRKSSGSTGV